jgi:dUTP pyrophosphatase
MTKLKIKKLSDKAVIPFYATPGAAGMDLTATEIEVHGGQMTYYTGLAVEIPKHYVGLLFPRSSVYKMDQSLANCVGVIDSDYRGEIMLRYRDLNRDSDKFYLPGDRVGQLVILALPFIQIEDATELSETDRGDGAFGSTGR